MSNKPRLTFRASQSLKHRLDREVDNKSNFMRDILERELDRRELAKDKAKKESPARIEELKELSKEINELNGRITEVRKRFNEVKETLENLKEERNEKQAVRSDIKQEVKQQTDLDEYVLESICESGIE